MNRFLVFCLLVIILLGVVAFTLHWINVSREVKPDGSSGVAVTVDREKFKQDMNAVKLAAKDAEEGVEKGVSRFGDHTITGEVVQVDPVGRHVTVRGPDKTVEVNVTDQTRIRTGDHDSHLTDLAAGETVKVSYTGNDKDLTARSIVVEKH